MAEDGADAVEAGTEEAAQTMEDAAESDMAAEDRPLDYYLTPETFGYLARAVGESDVRLLPEDLHGHLASTPAHTYAKFNLSDVFESFSQEENDAVWHQILRVATNGARVVYWCNQVERQPPRALAGQFVPDTPLQTALAAKDRLFFYRSFNIRVVRK